MGKEMNEAKYYALYIRTQYDGHDYRSVEEIYHYDENGEEEELKHLTELCIDISTCADQGKDTWWWIKDEVSKRLASTNTSYVELSFDDNEPVC